MPLDKRKYMESLLTETEAEFKELAFLSHTAFYTNHLEFQWSQLLTPHPWSPSDQVRKKNVWIPYPVSMWLLEVGDSLCY